MSNKSLQVRIDDRARLMYAVLAATNLPDKAQNVIGNKTNLKKHKKTLKVSCGVEKSGQCKIVGQ